MNIFDNLENQKIWDKLTLLKKSVEKERKNFLETRLHKKPHATDLEYLLGAFIEMYPPYLAKIIYKLYQKGYAIDPSSGFGGRNSEYQVMNGNFATDYVTKNKLEKMGIKIRESNGLKSMIFWPHNATLEDIKTEWMKIIDVLPDKGVLTIPSMNSDAVNFRRKYAPQRPYLQKQRLFEKLKYSVQKKMLNEITKRKTKNPHFNKIELNLGLFVEELEPQVRQAVLKLYKKGYSTDISGFMNNSGEQMIEGDFQLEEKIINKLKSIGVHVETNPSGYTRIHFLPEQANISKIRKKWDKIVSLIPDKHRYASASMTRKAREFRSKYQ
jgi:hypothetical protein